MLSLVGLAPVAAHSQTNELELAHKTPKPLSLKSYHLSGTVLDSASKKILPFVNVVVKRSNGFIVTGVATDMDGRFSLDFTAQLLDAHDLIVEVSFTGYQNKTLENIPFKDGKAVVEVYLQPSTKELEEVDIIYVTGLIDTGSIGFDQFDRGALKNSDRQ